MANGLPEGLWLPILIMVIIILGLLWNDRISKSKGKSSRSKSSSSDSTETTPPGPKFTSIVHRPVNPDPGEEVKFRAEYEAEADIDSYWFKVDGNKRDASISSSALETGPHTFEKGSYNYEAYIRDENGKSRSISSSFSVDSGETREGPTMSISEEWGDDFVTLKAEAHRGSSPIKKTVMSVDGVGEQEGENSASIDLPAEPGRVYEYHAWAVDKHDMRTENSGKITIPENPSTIAVKADYEVLSHADGKVKVWAQVTEHSGEIKETKIAYRLADPKHRNGEDKWTGAVKQEGSPHAEKIHENLPQEKYEIKAEATEIIDGKENVASDFNTFEIGVPGTGHGDILQDIPENARAIFQNTNNNFNGVSRQNFQLMRRILQEVAGQDNVGDDLEEVSNLFRRLMENLNTINEQNRLYNQLVYEELRNLVQETRNSDASISEEEWENKIRSIVEEVVERKLETSGGEENPQDTTTEPGGGPESGDEDEGDLNDDEETPSMSSSSGTDISHDAMQTLRDEADYEQNELHDALEDLAKIHDEHRYQSELEEKILKEGKNLLQDIEKFAEHLNRLNNGNMPDKSPSEINTTLKSDVSDIHTDIIQLKEDINEEMSQEKTVEELMPHLENIFESLESEEKRMEENVNKLMEQASSGSSGSHN